MSSVLNVAYFQLIEGLDVKKRNQLDADLGDSDARQEQQRALLSAVRSTMPIQNEG